MREVEDRMTKRRKALEGRAESLREYLHFHMERLMLKQLKSAELRARTPFLSHLTPPAL